MPPAQILHQYDPTHTHTHQRDIDHYNREESRDSLPQAYGAATHYCSSRPECYNQERMLSSDRCLSSPIQPGNQSSKVISGSYHQGQRSVINSITMVTCGLSGFPVRAVSIVILYNKAEHIHESAHTHLYLYKHTRQTTNNDIYEHWK